MPVALQGPREMAHLAPANPAAQEQVPLAALHTPPPMQSLFLEQPWLPHSCCETGIGPPLFMHACAEPVYYSYPAGRPWTVPTLYLKQGPQQELSRVYLGTLLLELPDWAELTMLRPV